jgi:hypothetical protein
MRLSFWGILVDYYSMTDRKSPREPGQRECMRVRGHWRRRPGLAAASCGTANQFASGFFTNPYELLDFLARAFYTVFPAVIRICV